MNIRVGIVDDEAPALKRISQVLSGFVNVTIVGLHTDPEQMLSEAAAGNIDLALLDMEMPHMHGLELGRRIYMIRPKVEIVYITAYQQYAHKAFEVEALDYIVKPVTKEKIGRALNRYIARRSVARPVHIMNAVVKCFGWFRVETISGELVKFRNSKSRELLALLLINQGAPVSKSKIIEALWPSKDAERSQVNLHSTVYQLRKDLEHYDIYDVVEQDKGEGGSYRLKYLPFMDEWLQFTELCASHRMHHDIRYAKEAVLLYQEGFLKEHDWEWAASVKQKAEADYQLLLEAVIRHELERGHYAEALPYLSVMVAQNPYHEVFQARIIAAHLLVSDPLAAETHYERAAHLFQEDLGERPPFTLKQIADDPAAFLYL
jgi:two-component system, LytTR family, response regulator